MRTKCLTDKHLVLIIQIQTGCEGLNLQENYSEIYLVSPNWNPCIEDQAIGRCHRIGQKKEVSVYKFEMVNDDSTAICNKVCQLPVELQKTIVEYIPISNMKWINLDQYINSVQDCKREITKEIISY